MSVPSTGSLRLCRVDRDGSSGGPLGFHLSRTQWDPYPWVSGVEPGSGAHIAGIRTGDCVLEVNGEDVLGLRIAEVARRVLGDPEERTRNNDTSVRGVNLLLWNAGSDPHVAATSVPTATPLSLQRLSGCLQTAAQLLECPVCMEVVRPPAWQCCHGHVLCGGCRARTTRCPVCRVPLGPRGRCLVADKLFLLLATTFSENKGSARTKELDCRDNPNIVSLKSRILPLRDVTHVRNKEDLTPRHISTQDGENKDQLEMSSECLYSCPRDSKCQNIQNKDDLMKHLQRDHSAPVLQYFIKENKKCEVNLKHTKKYIISILNEDNDVFFISSFHQSESCSSRLWLWFLGNEAEATKFNLKVHSNRNTILESPVVSLVNNFNYVFKNKTYVTLEANLTKMIIEIHKNIK